MSAFELIGYNKVADNTFVNIVPMTTGKFVKELPWTEDMKNVPFDKYDFNMEEMSHMNTLMSRIPDIRYVFGCK
jgi:hypothetical protein